ncbi:MAG: ketoacyl-ACP synthase III [Pirellulales bacterium]|nr:ketoacyl-ACP synthase III [Pirellulales bacterium]
MKYAAVGPIAVHLPVAVETNEQLKAENPRWDVDLIYEKVGIRKRHIAAPGECASDLGVAAAEKLFADYDIDRSTIDFLLLCTQTPDYPLPTTACLMQDRLGLPTHCGALDFNLGCSGFVYGLSLADGLIRSGAARRVLLVTAETYSRYITPDDRSLRTIFSDGAAATLIEAADEPSLEGFCFGTDGRGADMLIVNRGGARPTEQAIKPRGRQRWDSSLYMDGVNLIAITLETIPAMVERVLELSHRQGSDVDFFIMHQATRLMLEQLRQRIGIEPERLPIVLDQYGNTVSSTVPIVIQQLRADGLLTPGKRSILIGFGVGYSWAGCLCTETWRGDRAIAARNLAPYNF